MSRASSADTPSGIESSIACVHRHRSSNVATKSLHLLPFHLDARLAEDCLGYCQQGDLRGGSVRVRAVDGCQGAYMSLTSG